MASGGLADSRLLVVEDRVSHRQMLAEFLQENGFLVDAAASLTEGLERFRSGVSDPDIVVSLLKTLAECFNEIDLIIEGLKFPNYRHFPVQQ